MSDVGHYAILVAGQPPGWDMTALGLAMSMIRWLEGGVTMKPDDEHGELLYETIVQRSSAVFVSEYDKP